jgi:hypothetical protein
MSDNQQKQIEDDDTTKKWSDQATIHRNKERPSNNQIKQRHYKKQCREEV